MSIDENTNETEVSSQGEEGQQAEAASKQEAVSAPAGSAKNVAGNLLATVMALKESNPKVFFGGIGAIVLLLLIVMMSGGSDPRLPVYQAKSLVVGQSYVLKSPNTYDPSATIRLVSVPGSMAAYDDTEENDREGACKHMPQDTPVKLTQTQVDSTDKNVVWAEVEINVAGECQGRKAWTSGINLQ